MVKIIQLGDERLRETSEVIPQKDITSDEIQKLIRDLDDALNSQNDGVAISAPQIGVTKRVFVIAGKVFDEAYMKGNTDTPDPTFKNVYFINPKITKVSKKEITLEEGCLSIRGVYGNVKRPKNVTLQAYDNSGNALERGAGGLLARIFQHEIDHLDGILFIDKAVELWQDESYKQKN